jgi:hypothetical protein
VVDYSVPIIRAVLQWVLSEIAGPTAKPGASALLVAGKGTFRGLGPRLKDSERTPDRADPSRCGWFS